jgi:hypothetical protein
MKHFQVLDIYVTGVEYNFIHISKIVDRLETKRQRRQSVLFLYFGFREGEIVFKETWFINVTMSRDNASAVKPARTYAVALRRA